MRFKPYFILAPVVFGLMACTQPAEWTLFYYPDVDTVPGSADLNEAISGYYETAEQCETKGRGLIRLSQSGSGAYQCGHLCQRSDEGELVCERLTQSLIDDIGAGFS